MSTFGVITNTVTWFELQPERTKRRVKRDDLDTLTEIYTGPSAYEDTFVPIVGTMHANYTLMRVINTSVKRLVAGMTEITVNYQGKLANGSSYTSVPTVNKYWMEGEVSYQQNGSTGQTIAAPWGDGTIHYTGVTDPGVVSYTRRYTGRCVELSYITNNVPTGEPTNIGLAQGFMGFQNIWDIMAGFTSGITLSGAGGVQSQMACTDVRVEDRADGWYKVTETYQSRMFPGAAGYQRASGGITATAQNRLIDSSTTRPRGGGTGGSTNADNQTPDYSAYDFTKGMGGDPIGNATWSAQYGYADSLATSPAGSVGASTFGSTGMDPAYGSSDTTAPEDAAQIYPIISNDSAVPYSSDVGTDSQVYSG